MAPFCTWHSVECCSNLQHRHTAASAKNRVIFVGYSLLGSKKEITHFLITSLLPITSTFIITPSPFPHNLHIYYHPLPIIYTFIIYIIITPPLNNLHIYYHISIHLPLLPSYHSNILNVRSRLKESLRGRWFYSWMSASRSRLNESLRRKMIIFKNKKTIFLYIHVVWIDFSEIGQ